MTKRHAQRGILAYLHHNFAFAVFAEENRRMNADISVEDTSNDAAIAASLQEEADAEFHAEQQQQSAEHVSVHHERELLNEDDAESDKADPIADISASILAHINENCADELLHFVPDRTEEVFLSSVDKGGFTVLVDEEDELRVDFDENVYTREDFERAFYDKAREAERDKEYTHDLRQEKKYLGRSAASFENKKGAKPAQPVSCLLH